MKNIAIVNLIDHKPYFFEKINGEAQLDIIMEYSRSLPFVERVVFLLNEKIPGIDDAIVNDTWNEDLLINTLKKSSDGFDHLFYFFGDCPLLDKKLANDMFEDHINYYAEYTFADGYPYGLTPEIIDVEILQPLTILSRDQKGDITRESIFNVVKKDINSFELETKIAEKDLRLKRISLTSDSKRNFNQMLRIIELGGVDAASIEKVIEDNEDILLVEPSYITLEITKKKIQSASYLPERLVKQEYMNIKDLKTILEKVKDYSDDAVFAFVPEYEPTTHPDLLEIIKSITSYSDFKLYIETSGLGWTDELTKEVTDNSKVNLIITLDSLNPDLYRKIRGEGQKEATDFALGMISLIKDRVWIQATRMKTNEADMEPFYRYWQEHTENIIVQKYSDYNKRLPDLKVADLSPLKRFPCWHLKRDLHINTEGEALLCFNDLESEYTLGSVVKEDISEIINKKREYYMEQINCEYSDFCRNCDEYYTFNF